MQIHSENIFLNRPDQDYGQDRCQDRSKLTGKVSSPDPARRIVRFNFQPRSGTVIVHNFSTQCRPEEDGCQGAPQENE